MKVLLLTLLLGLVCSAQEEEAEQSASEVPGMVWPGRRPCVCVCVCVCVCSFCRFLMCTHKQAASFQLNTAPFAGLTPVLFHLYIISIMYSLAIRHFSCSCNRGRGSAHLLLGWVSSMWCQRPSSPEMHALLLWLRLQLHVIFINRALFSQVR